MKNIFSAICLLLTVSVFPTALNAAEVKLKQDSPSCAAITFFATMARGEFGKAKNMLETKELAQMVSGLEQMIKDMPEIKDELIKDAKKSFLPMRNSKIISEKINGNEAEVVISYIENKKKKQGTVKLKKISGTWKIVDLK